MYIGIYINIYVYRYIYMCIYLNTYVYIYNSPLLNPLFQSSIPTPTRWQAPEGFESHGQTPLQRRSLLRAAGRRLCLAGSR